MNSNRFLSTMLGVLCALAAAGTASGETVLRAVMHSDLKIIDPVWTTANITRNHGYMIYDTLFALDERGEIKPRMVQTYDVSSDRRIYTFTLRSGLLWHDGLPVTSEDCIASIKRWSTKDAAGQILMQFSEGLESSDPPTFRLKLKEPTAPVITALSKRSFPAF